MKKLLSFLFLPFVCGVCYGESMNFVTVLSSPVGSFNKLEAVDSQTPAKGVTVNFCTQEGTSGTVELKGTDNAKLNRLNIGNNTTLGRTGAGKYSLGRITLAPGGDLMGGQLMGEVVTVNSGTAGRAKNVYGTGLTVKGAGADKLTVGTGSNVESKIENKAISDPGMVWSNEYQTDTACKGKAVSCANQYLLKTGHGAVSGNCSTYAYKVEHKSECCPGTPTTDTTCWSPVYKWTESLWYTQGHNGVVVNTASGGCTSSSYNGGEGETVYPKEFNSMMVFVKDAPQCERLGISAGQKCESTSSTCFLGLSKNWIQQLRSYHTKYNESFHYPNMYYDSNTNPSAQRVGCVWNEVNRWPQLLCEPSNEYEHNGW